MSTAYLMHGFLGVGKTTLAEQIASSVGAVRISADEWYIALYGSDGQLGIDIAKEQRLRNFLWETWPSWATAGVDVVLDMGFWTRADRDRARGITDRAGVSLLLFELVTSDSTALARCEGRNMNPTAAFFIDEQIYATLKQGFEPLSPDEERITVRT